ncbi:hypothetical protein ACFLQN_02610 [Candidatus Aenigmatarchaeota archaeon]
MNKYIIMLLFMLVITTGVVAAFDANSIENIEDEYYIIQDDATYKILSDENIIIVYYDQGVHEYRRIVFENITKVKEMEENGITLINEINRLSDKIIQLDKVSQALFEQEEISEKIAVSLEEERSILAKEIDTLELKGVEFENRITGLIPISTVSFRVAIVIFIILLLVVLIVKGSALLGGSDDHDSGKSPPKTKDVESTPPPEPPVQPIVAPAVTTSYDDTVVDTKPNNEPNNPNNL